MHTLETLLPLLDSPEGLEKLRILAAEADGWKHDPESWDFSGEDVYKKEGEIYVTRSTIPPYPNSLDAIFAAEERLGLHEGNSDLIKHTVNICLKAGILPYFFTAAYRCIAFILTAQEVKNK